MSVASWFLASPPTTTGPRPGGVPTPAPAPVAGRIAILLQGGPGPREHGAVLALALARAGRAPAVLMLGWHEAGPLPAVLPAAPAGRRLARSLRARELAVRTAGRIVHVALPGDDEHAAQAVTRAVAAAPAEVPVLIALAGPRGPALDGLLPGADVVVVAGSDDEPRARAALDGVREAGLPAVAWTATPGPLVRRLARGGLAVGAGRIPREALR